MTIYGKRKTVLNREDCFKLWAELGSLEKVSLFLASTGKVNPKTKKPFYITTIRYHAMRWVFDYPDEAREYYIALDAFLDDDQWERYLIKNAVYILKLLPTQFFLFIERNKFQKYEDMYKKKLGTYENWKANIGKLGINV